LSSLKWVKDFSTPLVPIMIAAAYVTGITMERILEASAAYLPEIVKAVFRDPKVRRIEHSVGGSRKVRLWQNASQYLVAQIDDDWYRLNLLRALTAAIPALGLSVGLWLITADHRVTGLVLMLAVALVTCLIILAHRVQYRNYEQLISCALDEIAPVRASGRV
jgi:hypothetical protein